MLHMRAARALFGGLLVQEGAPRRKRDRDKVFGDRERQGGLGERSHGVVGKGWLRWSETQFGSPASDPKEKVGDHGATPDRLDGGLLTGAGSSASHSRPKGKWPGHRPSVPSRR